jgi:membrane fusion protein (multidrug efflux system)
MSSATAAGVPRVIDEAPTRVRARRRLRLLRPILMLGGILVVAVGGFTWWLTGGRYVSIDDAYVQAAKVSVSTDVSGLVAGVDVHEGEQVHQGQLLFRLDPRQFQIALEGAKADLIQAGLIMDSMKRDYQRMLRDIEVKQADVADDDANFNRYASLVKTGAVTRAEYDNARFKLAADQQQVLALREQAQVQLAKLGGKPDIDVTTAAQYLAAKARVDEAQRELDHTVVRAPFDGVVTQVDQLQPGQYLAASTGAFGLVSTDRVWVEANPKETELTWVKPGDHATVDVDTYPGRHWDGVVETIAPNSGSEFSILPAQNASGNWVKVVQRIALRVRVERRPGDPPLRTGMSVEVEIDTGHHRRLADLF